MPYLNFWNCGIPKSDLDNRTTLGYSLGNIGSVLNQNSLDLPSDNLDNRTASGSPPRMNNSVVSQSFLDLPTDDIDVNTTCSMSIDENSARTDSAFADNSFTFGKNGGDDDVCDHLTVRTVSACVDDSHGCGKITEDHDDDHVENLPNHGVPVLPVVGMDEDLSIGSSYTVIVKTIDGSEKYDVFPYSTVEELKTSILKRQHISEFDTILTFEKKLLTSGLLSNFGIYDNGVVYLRYKQLSDGEISGSDSSNIEPQLPESCSAYCNICEVYVEFSLEERKTYSVDPSWTVTYFKSIVEKDVKSVCADFDLFLDLQLLTEGDLRSYGVTKGSVFRLCYNFHTYPRRIRKQYFRDLKQSAISDHNEKIKELGLVPNDENFPIFITKQCSFSSVYMVSPTCTVDDVRQWVFITYGYTAPTYHLKFRDRLLSSGLLEDYAITEDSLIQVIDDEPNERTSGRVINDECYSSGGPVFNSPNESSGGAIYLELPDGITKSFPINDSTTVEDLITFIKLNFNFVFDDIFLKTGTKVLVSGLLVNYNVEIGSTVFVLWRLKGGGGNMCDSYSGFIYSSKVSRPYISNYCFDDLYHNPSAGCDDFFVSSFTGRSDQLFDDSCFVVNTCVDQIHVSEIVTSVDDVVLSSSVLHNTTATNRHYDNNILIFIEMFDGGVESYTTSLFSSVDDIRQFIYNNCHISHDKYFLRNGTTVLGTGSLLNAGIKNRDVIRMSLRIRGGITGTSRDMSIPDMVFFCHTCSQVVDIVKRRSITMCALCRGHLIERTERGQVALPPSVIYEAPPLDAPGSNVIPSLLLDRNGDVVNGRHGSNRGPNLPPPVDVVPTEDYAKKLVKFEASSDCVDDPTCGICLCDYELKNEISIFSDKVPCDVSKLACNHVFHYECIASWLRQGRNECPKCRGVAVILNG